MFRGRLITRLDHWSIMLKIRPPYNIIMPLHSVFEMNQIIGARTKVLRGRTIRTQDDKYGYAALRSNFQTKEGTCFIRDFDDSYVYVIDYAGRYLGLAGVI